MSDACQGARLREKSENENVEEAEDDEEDEDDEDDDEDIDEELGYISPLENVNPYVSFKQALTSTFAFPSISAFLLNIGAAFQMQNGPSYQAATTALSMEQSTLLMEVMRIAEQPAAPAP